MSKPWGGIGSWAADAEAEEREQAAAAAKSNVDLQRFPSLKDSVSSKPKKKKIPLSEFMAGGGTAGSRPSGLTPVEMLQLPTGPQQRSLDDYHSGNRGFSAYGRSSGGPPGRMREGDSDSSWGGGHRSYGGFDDDRRGALRRGPDYDLQPSRADEVSNWGAVKKSIPPPSMDSGRISRYESHGGGSRADDGDSWNFGKKPTAAPPPPVRYNTFGYGDRDSTIDSNRWSRDGEVRERDNQSNRPTLVLNPPKCNGAVTEPPVEKANKPNPFGAARPREDILAGKGVDWKKIELEIEAKKSVSSRPTSSQGSRPSSAHSSRSENTGLGQHGLAMVADVGVKPRPKVNPFGDAKPREVVLQEKGKDWRKIDLELEHRAIDRPETEEERILKEEIDRLKKELPSDPSQVCGADEASIGDVIQIREKELQVLIRELDDKVKFGAKAVERPGSGAGRFGSFSDRPKSSQSGSIYDGQRADFADRPRSRGNPDVTDDRRGSFHGGSRDREFRGSRNFDSETGKNKYGVVKLVAFTFVGIVFGFSVGVIFPTTRPSNMIWVPSNPEGAERLPPGIVASESDLYLHRLWGNPSEDLKVKPKYLVCFTVGFAQKKNVDAAVKKFSEDFSIVLFHYDGKTTEWNEFEWSKRAVHISVERQTKWWYAKRFLHPDIVASYDYIFIWDEDLGVEHFNAKQYLEVVKKYGLEISQPGLEPNHGLTWQMTKRRGDLEAHKRAAEKHGWCTHPNKPPCAGFVEIMAPVFSQSAWRCVWHMIQNDLVHGWGLDFALGKCVEPAHEKIGVVDSQWIVHQRIPSLGSQGEGQSPRKGVRERCRSEWKMFQNRLEQAEKQWSSSYQALNIN
ncbi:hypothetical protein V2J09_019929 [Rumex salicifolius]